MIYGRNPRLDDIMHKLNILANGDSFMVRNALQHASKINKNGPHLNDVMDYILKRTGKIHV